MSVLVLLFACVLSQAVPPAAVESAASIRGRVTDQASGEAMAGVLVRIMPMGDYQPKHALTDANGRYEIAGLAPGRYLVIAEPVGHTVTHVPVLFGKASVSIYVIESQRPSLELAAGERRTDVDFQLQRALAIAGRLVDGSGRPIADIRVKAERVDGSRTEFRGWFGLSDDRGAFRLYRLPPGKYRVCADGAVDDEFGLSEAAPRRLVRTCYPSATTDAEAATVELKSADADVEIIVQAAQTYTVSGFVTHASGIPLPKGTMATLARASPRGGVGYHRLGIDADGRFTEPGLLPGEYAIKAEVMRDTGPHEVARVPFRIVNADVDGLIVPLAPSAALRGRVVFAEHEDQKVTFEPVMEAYARWDRDLARTMPPPPPYDRVARDRSFQLVGLSGPMIVDINQPPKGWTLKQVRYKGNDITNVPTVFSSSEDPSLLEIVLTSKGAVVAGTVSGADGKPVLGAHVVLFPADPAVWKSMGRPASAMTAGDGRFELEPRAEGDYMIVAVDAEQPPPFRDVATFERLSKHAERLTLKESERRAVTLRPVRPDEER